MIKLSFLNQPCLGLSSLGILLMAQMPVIALPEAKAVKRLETVPTFAVTDEKGVPVLANVPNPEDKSKKIQVATFFMSQIDAQKLVDKFRSQQPEIGKSARVTSLSLRDAYEITKKHKDKQDQLFFQFLPTQEQVDFAETILKQEGQEVKQFNGVPIFFATSGKEKEPITIEQGQEKITPFYLRKQDLQRMIEQLKKQKSPLIGTMRIQVTSLDQIVGSLLKSEKPSAKNITIIPARDALEYAMQQQKQTKTTALNPLSPQEVATDVPASKTATKKPATVPQSVVSTTTRSLDQGDVETSSNEIATKSTSIPSNPVSSEDIYETARKTTILIQGQNPGSGVIISKKANTYYILTAKHVVETPDEYTIVAPDNKQYEIDYSKVKKLRGVDLAILEFNSDQNYQIADLGDSDQVRAGSSIYVSGWPAPGKAITKSTHLVTEGKVSGFQEDLDGYEWLYSNSTAPGMSGGAVINNQGKVVGIHGRAEGNDLSGKVGINLGIPVKLFLKFAPQVGFDSGNLES